MAKNFDPKVYGAILRTRQAYVFDAACFLMRFYIFMLNIGIITMLTLSGHSFLIAGLVSSTIALATFFISPRISKVIDEKGQSRIVPIFSAITIAGLIILLSDVVLDGPEPVLFVGAILMGCVPNPQALARTRWIFLIKTGRLKDKAPELRTMFSYESVMDDVGFMFSPAISIALASALFPSAGMITGGVAFVVGVIMLTCAKSTAPTPGWGEPAETAHHDKSVIRTSRVVVVLFLLMLCFGGFFGVFDTSTVALAEEFGAPTLASLVLVVASLESIIVGFVFGMFRLRAPQYRQLVVAAICIGLGFGLMVFVNSIGSLIAVALLGTLFYAPFLIVANDTCERAVPTDRLTEAITWMNAGSMCGSAFGPSVAGILIDLYGASSAFKVGAVIAIMIPVIALLSSRILKNDIAAVDSEKLAQTSRE